MEGLKQQLERVEELNEEIDELVEEAGFDVTAEEGDIERFRRWRDAEGNNYRHLVRMRDKEAYHLSQAIRTVGGNHITYDQIITEDKERVEREIEAAYRLSDRREVKA